MRFLDIDPRAGAPEAAKPFRWVDIERPNREVLENIAGRFKLSPSIVAHCLAEHVPVGEQRSRDALFLSAKEFSLTGAERAKLDTADLIIIVTENALLTLHRGPSAAVERVQSEYQRREIPADELLCPNYLACRLLGSTLHTAEEVVSELEDRSDSLNGGHSRGGPKRADLRRAEQLARSARKCQSIMSASTELVAALGERRNLFTVPEPKDALRRYEAMLRSLHDRSNEVTEAIDDRVDAWGIEAQNESNRYVARLAWATGALAIPVAVFGFFGQNFSALGLSDAAIVAVNALGFAGSAVLLGALWAAGKRRHR